MSDARKAGFVRRPSDPENWVRAADRTAAAPNPNSARLTLDVTPALRGRLKVIAFRRGETVADMLRALLEREFPDEGAAP